MCVTTTQVSNQLEPILHKNLPEVPTEEPILVNPPGERHVPLSWNALTPSTAEAQRQRVGVPS